MGAFDSMSGVVVSFDDHGGYGTVQSPDGTTWTFHCTAIADQSRSIDRGAEVAFEVVPGRGGRWEATNLRPT